MWMGRIFLAFGTAHLPINQIVYSCLLNTYAMLIVERTSGQDKYHELY